MQYAWELQALFSSLYPAFEIRRIAVVCFLVISPLSQAVAAAAQLLAAAVTYVCGWRAFRLPSRLLAASMQCKMRL